MGLEVRSSLPKYAAGQLVPDMHCPFVMKRTQKRRLTFLSSCAVGCLLLSGLASAVACLPFPFPRLWSSCLNAPFAPREHEPFDDQCLQFHVSPSSLFFPVVRLGLLNLFSRPFSFWFLRKNFAADLSNLWYQSFQPRLVFRLFTRPFSFCFFFF